MASEIAVSSDDGVMEIRFARPAKLNAMTAAMYGAAAEAIEDFNRSEALSALVFSGEGGHFCAGLVRPRAIGRDTIASILHTGGTTGLPKLVPQTHGNHIHAAWSFAQMFSIDETDVIINGMPMVHVGGTITFQLSVLAAAGHMILTAPAGFRDPAVVANYWAMVERFRVTMAGGVPTTIAAIADVPVDGHDISSLRMALTGGAILPSTVAARFEQRAGIPLLEQYGMTETLANIATTPFHGEKRRGSVGYRAPFGGIRIGSTSPDDGSGEGAAAEVIGPVSCRGPNVFPGYLSAEHRQGLFLGEGWMSTGDIGFMTRQGQLVLTGREKDLIIRSAHNIDPAVIEEAANSHPDISLSAAVGMPDAYAGEVPVIFVEPVPGRQIDLAELLGYITARVPEPPAKPRHVYVLAEIPKKRRASGVASPRTAARLPWSRQAAER
ncbi:fatty-acyl-CoA synthase [Hoeflea marina]|uniref:Fatty-acyl-CoA synthase n=1 Tax=Hoeflea marina TaxID=274592 RepID=A0A317PS62_9HYPH|nr:AMP-binding protein [Hoeflea marina]PWW03575.1 fatty-acyl-CoA synthase [Hoeflea marina]